MEQYHESLTEHLVSGRRIIVLVTIASTIFSFGAVAGAQTRTARDSATAYGARLTAKGEPADLNPNRINNRVNSRIDSRLSLRIERYRPDSLAGPAAAFALQATDNARIGTETTLSPLATSSQGDAAPTSQTLSERTDDAARPR